MPEQKKIKIVHVIPTLDMGGAERLLVDIVKRVDKTYFDLTVICFKRGGVWEEEIKQSGAKLVILKKKNKFDIINFFKLRQAIIAEQPQIIHTHLGGDIYGRLIAGRLGIKVISTEHNLNKDESFFTTWLKRLTAGYASLIIAVSQAVAKDARQRYGIKDNKFKVIYNGIDLLRFSKAKIFNSEVIKIGTVGRLVRQKNFATLIEALSMMQDKNFTCEIVGQGYLKQELADKIKFLGLADKVRLVGTTNNIPEFLSQLDIFILPSLWEGLGMAVLEAGASGLPVIASAVDGLVEIIDDKVNGLLFEANNANDLKNKINYLLEHQVEAKTWATNLSKKVAEQFDVVNMVRQYELVYKSLVQD